MPSNDERWLDAEAGPVVRPYALTQGRTRHTGASFDLVATVMATRARVADPSSLAPEHMNVLQLARAPTTVADIASDVDLPLGVVRIILADLRELGLIVISTPVVMAERVDRPPLREVLTGLRGLCFRRRPPEKVGPVRHHQDSPARRVRSGQHHAGRRR